MEPEKPSHGGGIAATFLAIAVVLIFAFFALSNAPFIGNIFNIGLNNPRVQISETEVPQSVSSNITIGKPSDYVTLANYALGVINKDRANYNLSAVVLSPILSAQEHAYSMFEYGYFSHWDTQGLKPYMRYTLLNGSGYVEENVAFEETACASQICVPSFTSTYSVERVISALEYQMMYNDSGCCFNGHRDNILSPYHNRVSIGMMYDSAHVYFVEDFENYFIQLNTPIFNSSSSLVTLAGNISKQLSPDNVQVSFDPTPSPINSSTLNGEFQKPYDLGTPIGGAIPCSGGVITIDAACRSFLGQNMTTVRPTVWSVNETYVDIVFSLSKLVSTSGSGVYTIYLAKGTSEYLTSISLFIQT